MKVKNEVCWVSGAAQGIGLELCRILVQLGGKVVMVDIIGQQQGQKLAEELSSSSSGEGAAAFVHADLSDISQVAASMKRAKEIFGSVATIVVNNAGISVKDDDPRLKTMLDLNCTAVIVGSQIAAEALKASGKKGCIINTASFGGLFPVRETPAYAGTKWAVVGYTISCRGMLKTHGVRVNCVCPSLVDTAGVGEFFKGEFAGQKIEKELLRDILDPKTIAEAMLAIIQNDKINAKPIVVRPHKTYVHKFNFRSVMSQNTDNAIPPLSKL